MPISNVNQLSQALLSGTHLKVGSDQQIHKQGAVAHFFQSLGDHFRSDDTIKARNEALYAKMESLMTSDQGDDCRVVGKETNGSKRMEILSRAVLLSALSGLGDISKDQRRLVKDAVLEDFGTFDWGRVADVKVLDLKVRNLVALRQVAAEKAEKYHLPFAVASRVVSTTVNSSPWAKNPTPDIIANLGEAATREAAQYKPRDPDAEATKDAARADHANPVKDAASLEEARTMAQKYFGSAIRRFFSAPQSLHTRSNYMTGASKCLFERVTRYATDEERSDAEDSVARRLAAAGNDSKAVEKILFESFLKISAKALVDHSMAPVAEKASSAFSTGVKAKAFYDRVGRDVDVAVSVNLNGILHLGREHDYELNEFVSAVKDLVQRAVMSSADLSSKEVQMPD